WLFQSSLRESRPERQSRMALQERSRNLRFEATRSKLPPDQPQEHRMCRNIKTLHNFKPPATEAEIRASALQFVRKLSGFARPSKANEPAFEHAVEHVAQAAHELLDAL